MKVGIHRWVIITCYISVNGDSERPSDEFKKKMYNILNEYAKMLFLLLWIDERKSPES